jgi:hypothetical protein
MPLWEDHLLPLLTCKDAARLACTCKALRGVVREHFCADLGKVTSSLLRAAMTTFPRARSVEVSTIGQEWEPGSKEALLQWLCEGGRGRHLALVRSIGEGASDLVHTALRQGALPSLKGVMVRMDVEAARASLTGGLLGAMHELQVLIYYKLPSIPPEPQLAALGLVRQLPALAKLAVVVITEDDDAVEVQWPPFIPLSLKVLRIDLIEVRSSSQFLLALPGVLEASGARLDRLEVLLPDDFWEIGDGLVHLAQALRCCSPTLKGFLLSGGVDAPEDDETGSQVERLHVHWGDVLAGVSACRELQVLVLPNIEVEPLFPPGTAFAHLTHLEISDHEREHPPDAGAMGLWELMASGGLPALAKLKVRLGGRWRGVGLGEVRSRVAPALEAVAGTLTHLHLDKVAPDRWRDKDEGWGFELGVAVGKLRRLKDLALRLSKGGRVYHAFAQGLAAVGGDRPLPLLWRVSLRSEVKTNADLLSSLLLPSLQVFGSCHSSARAALLTACALRQAGYKHTWAVSRAYANISRKTLGSIASCSKVVADRGALCPWATSLLGRLCLPDSFVS